MPLSWNPAVLALPALLAACDDPSDVAVVACHACSHLTDAIIDICVARGIDFACLPCCQRDMLTSNYNAVRI